MNTPEAHSTRTLLGSTGPILALALLSLSLVSAGARWSDPVTKALDTITSAELVQHVVVLASDEYQGRRVGNRGALMAGDYIAKRFEELGLEPGGDEGSYFQAFALKKKTPRVGPLSDVNHLRYGRKPNDPKQEAAEYGTDFVLHSHSPDGEVTGPVHFVGFEGGIGPEVSDKVRGRVAALLGATVTTPASLAQLQHRVAQCKQKGAVAVLLLPSVKDAELPSTGTFDPAGIPEDEYLALPVARLSGAAADRLFAQAGKRFTEVLAGAEKGRAPSMELKKCHVQLETRRKGWTYDQGRNVVAVWRGSDPKLKDEAIVIGAHYDHLGFPVSKRVSKGTLKSLHNGADDNASGTAGLIEVAEAFVEKQIATGRTVIFIAFDGEEFGLLGSRAYCESGGWPIDKIACMLNIDMISRNATRSMKFGTDEKYVGLNTVVRGVAKRVNISLDSEGMKKYWRRSDHYAFVKKGVPACFLFGGMHRDYHTENDDVERINKIKIEVIARLMFLLAYECANHDGLFAE